MSAPGRHPGDDALQEWIDGTLSAREADRVADHVAACAACREEAARVRGLLAALGSLPRAMATPESVRAGARARALGSGAAGPHVVPAGSRRGGSRAGLRRAGLAAAAVALVAIGAAAGLLLGPDGEPPADRPGLASGAGSPAPISDPAVRRVTDDYDRAVADLAAELETRRAGLDPETVRIVEESLRIIDGALREARVALAADPSDPVLRDLVVAGYQQKLDLLRRATRPVEEI